MMDDHSVRTMDAFYFVPRPCLPAGRFRHSSFVNICAHLRNHIFIYLHSTMNYRMIRLKLPHITVSVFCGAILALSFAPFNINFLAWIGFLPLFFIIQNLSFKKSFVFFYISGLAFFLISLCWLINVTILGWILLCLYLSLYFGFFGSIFSFFSRWLSQEKKSFFLLIAVPAAWVGMEFLRSHILSGFGWNLIGYSQFKELNLIQITDICAVYGVSFLIMFVNCILWLTVFKLRTLSRTLIKSQILILFLIFAGIAGLVAGYGKQRLNQAFSNNNEEWLRISVIQPNISQDLKWDPAAREYIFEQLVSLTLLAKKDDPDMVIWPESAVPVYFQENSLDLDRIFRLAKQLKIYLLTGVIIYENDKFYNSALLISPQGKVVGRYDKLHLVPFGEFVPLGEILPFLSTVVGIGDFTPGEVYKVFELSKGGEDKFSVLICFEDAFSYLSRQFRNRGAALLVNITNDAWFGQSGQPEQHLANSVFRAIENRVNVIRSANTGISALIDAKGRVKKIVADASGKEIFISGFETFSLNQKSLCPTFYNRFGDLFAYLCITLTIIALALIKFSSKKTSRNG